MITRGRTGRSSRAGTPLKDATVLVTGASRGLGKDLAVEFARREARVVLVARDKDALAEVSASTGGEWFAADLANTRGIEPLVDKIEQRCGPIDVVVNNAAVSWLEPLRGCTTEQISSTLAVNLAAPAEFARVLLPRMESRSSGHIVNIASLGGVIAIPGLAAYGASKAGLAHLCAVLREELRDSPVLLTLVQLGAIEGTEMYDEVMRSPMVSRIVRRMAAVGMDMAEPAPSVARKIADAIEGGRREKFIPALAGGLHYLRQSPVVLARAAAGSKGNQS